MIYKILRSRKVQPLPAMWNGIYQTSELSKEIHGCALARTYMYFEEGVLTQFYEESDWEEMAEKIKDKVLQDHKYVETIYDKQFELGERLVGVAKSYKNIDFDQFPIEKLQSLLEDLEKDNNLFNSFNVLPWFVGGDKIHEYIEKEIKKVAKISQEDFQSLMSPTMQSFSADEEQLQLKIALEIKQQHYQTGNWPGTIIKKIDDLVEKYSWIPFGYDGPDLYTREYYQEVVTKIVEDFSEENISSKLNEIINYKEVKSNKQAEIREKLELSESLWRIIKDYHKINLMTDQRKEFTFQSHVLINRILDSIARKIGVETVHLKYIMVSEINSLANSPAEIIKLANKRINNPVLFIGEHGLLSIKAGDEAENYKKQLLLKVESQDALSGMIACLGSGGLTRGKVKVIFSPSEMRKMQQGDILVASMTTPEYVPIMRMAKAIITDEGGVTCHAAIVSRELNIPCIIATKIATKILNDGDMVEVDVNNSVVRIIR